MHHFATTSQVKHIKFQTLISLNIIVNKIILRVLVTDYTVNKPLLRLINVIRLEELFDISLLALGT